MSAVLSVQNLRKVYPGKPPFVAVDGISFELGRGEILGLLGPNGAGKTTTIQMLLGTLTYSSGSITYLGKDFLKHRSEALQNVAFASTYVSLPWALTLEQNLEIFGRLYGYSKKENKAKVDILLERFGIADKRKTMVGRLSAGQVTRVMLVKAFMVDPKIVLLDEPTASLDPDIAKEVCRFLLEEREKRGISILFTSHKMDEVAELCDRVLFIQKGKIIADDLPENLARSVSSCKLLLIVGDGLKRTAALAEGFKMPHTIEHRSIEIQLDESQISEFLTKLANAGVAYSSIKIEQPTLEDYFLKMVGQK